MIKEINYRYGFRTNDEKNNQVEYIKFYLDGSTTADVTFPNRRKCLEVVKNGFGVFEYVVLGIKASDVKYSQEEIERWVGLLNNSSYRCKYIVVGDYHEIKIRYSNYNSRLDFYLALILVRYLWYIDNDGYIDRIFDILDNSSIDFNSAVVMAVFFDNEPRDATFNLFHCNYALLNLQTNLRDLIDNQYNYLNDHLRDCTFSTFKDLSIFKKLQTSILYYTNLYLKTEIKSCKTYDEVYSLIDNTRNIIYAPTIDFYNWKFEFINYMSKVLSLLNKKKIKVLDIVDFKEVEVGKNYCTGVSIFNNILAKDSRYATSYKGTIHYTNKEILEIIYE